MVRVTGRPFRCPCGANVFRKRIKFIVTNGKVGAEEVYICNGCRREYA